MAEERLQRRLAAILSADVVGYSRLMGLDIGTDNTTPPACKCASKIVKISAVSRKAMHAKYRAISSRRSPIGKRDPVKASPRQPTNRSHPIRHDRTPFGVPCWRRFRRRSLRLRAIEHLLI
jgi:hypothetical protein